MQNSDRQYFIEREQRERAAADRCKDMAARHIHLELAKRYQQLAMPQPEAA